MPRQKDRPIPHKKRSGKTDKGLKKGQLEPLRIRKDTAGLDVGATEIYVAVPPDKDPRPVRSFPTFTRDLCAMADWLEQCGIRSVAMESTGVYWIPAFQVLEERGLEVCLVNAQHLKNVPGRKTDVADCQWIQQVHSLGLLSASFRPAQQVCAVRSLLRHKQGLIEMASQQILLMQKALDQMNLQLHHVLSDITGASGTAILDAILAGERDPAKLAELRDRRVKASRETILKALEGDYRPEHLFTLGQSLELYRFLLRHIAQCQTQIREYIQTWEGKVNPDQTPAPAACKAIKAEGLSSVEAEGVRAECYRIWGVDLTQVEGINVHFLQVLTAEVGPDMGRFRSAAAFASWLGLSPKREVSGGKVLKTRTARNGNRVATAFRMAANSLLRSESPLGSCFRRLRSKLGAPKAITAMAHKLARIVYHLVTTGQPYDNQVFLRQQEEQQKRREKRVRDEAAKLGFHLVPNAISAQ